MKKLCKKFNLNNSYKIMDVNEATELLIETINKITQESTLNLQNKSKMKPRSDWITEGIIKYYNKKTIYIKNGKKTLVI